MEAFFKKSLDESEVRAIREFCLTADYFAIEQSTGFTEALYKTPITYFYLTGKDGIKSFAQINETFRFAHIWFGPVCDDREAMVESVIRIAGYYSSKGYWYLGIQPYRKSGFDGDYIEYALNQHLRITYLFTNRHTKSSLEIDLRKDKDTIWSAFSKGHKSAVKKAIGHNISVVEMSSASELDGFLLLYDKMKKARGIGGHTVSEIIHICRYIADNNCGVILMAKTQDATVIGCSVFASQGKSVRYLLSASDPERRDLPITHLIIYRAIELAKERGFTFFDFWGYNHFANPDEQMAKINRFKRGFGGYYTFFMKKMNISLIPLGFLIYEMFQRSKKGISKFRKVYCRKNTEHIFF